MLLLWSIRVVVVVVLLLRGVCEMVVVMREMCVVSVFWMALVEFDDLRVVLKIASDSRLLDQGLAVWEWGEDVLCVLRMIVTGDTPM